MTQLKQMHWHTLRYAAFFSMMLTFSLSVEAASENSTVAALRVDINHALISGDLSALDRLGPKYPDVPKAVFDMAKSRVKYDLEASNESARQCETALGDHEPTLAFYCARFAAGNLRLQGELREAAKAELAIVKRYAGILTSKELANPDVAQAPALIALPDMTKHVPIEPFSVPLFRDEGGRLIARLTIGGVDVKFLVDTAAYTILSKETAKAVKAHTVLEDNGTAYGASGHGTQQQLAVVDTLVVGDASLHHIPITVADVGIDVLGLDVLRHLGPVRISKDAMQFYPVSQAPIECDQSLMIAAPFWGVNPQLLTNQPFDGVAHAMVLDTGSIFYLTGTKRAESFVTHGAPEPIHLGDLTARSRASTYLPSKGRLELAGVERPISFMTFPSYDLNYDFLIGNRALDDVDFWIDFDHRHLCLSGKASH